MKAIVVYTSKYGSAEKYARWLGEALNCPAKKLGEVSAQELADYDTIIYGGGIYAGSVAGLKKFLAKLDSPQGKRLVLFMVGITNPAEEKVYADIVERGLSPKWRDHFTTFALRGDQLFTKMSGLHKLMMRIPKAAAEKKPEAERSADDKRFIEEFGNDIVFASREQLEPLIKSLTENQ